MCIAGFNFCLGLGIFLSDSILQVCSAGIQLVALMKIFSVSEGLRMAYLSLDSLKYSLGGLIA